MIQATAVQAAFKLALSMMLFYWLALSMNWPNASDGGLAIALISLATTGASLNKGIMRVAGLGVGAFFGLILVAAFPQERWAFLVAMSLYLVFVAYFVQLSQRKYAWTMMAMGALFTWVASYQRAPLAFGPAFDKFAVTASGVLIYTLVSMLLWPKSAGARLTELGRSHLQDLTQLLVSAREREPDREALNKLATKTTGSVTALLACIQEASLDSPTVAMRKRSWLMVGVHLRALTDSIQFWLPSIELAAGLDLARHLPTLDEDMERLTARLEACKESWMTDLAEAQPDFDCELQTDLALEIHEDSALDVPARAKLLNLVRHMKALDNASRAFMESLDALALPKATGGGASTSALMSYYRPALWDPERLLKALLPAICFAAAFLFWVYSANPPGGTALPMLAGVFGMVLVMAPMNLIGLLIYLILSALAILPIYLWLMPNLPQGGGSILGLIFVYTFVVGLLGARSPALQLGPLIMFLAVSGIKNEQTYSFMGFMTVASMLLLTGVIVTVVHGLVHTIRPEKNLRRSVNRFFRGCSSILGTYEQDDSAAPGTASGLRRRYFDAMIQSAPMQIGLAAKGFDHATFKGTSPEGIQTLLHCLQSLAMRIQALDSSRRDARTLSKDLDNTLAPFGRELRRMIAKLFGKWQVFNLERHSEEEVQRMREMTQDLNDQLELMESRMDDESMFAEDLSSAYAMLGNIQLLLVTMSETRDALEEIDWEQLALARF